MFKIVIRQISTLILALAAGLATALIIVAVFGLVDPEIFGSCFEGGCGYAALYLFAPVVTLFTAVAWWFVLRRAGLLIRFLLWFLVLLAAGYFVLNPFVWVASLTGLLWAVIEVVLRRRLASSTDSRMTTHATAEARTVSRPDTTEDINR